MVSFLFAVLFLLVTVVAIILRKTYFFVPANELKRQAQSGDPLAKTLYRAVGYGSSLRALLWLTIAISAAAGFMLLAQVAPSWMGFLVVAIGLWLAFSWLPNTRVTALGSRLAVTATPAVAWVLSLLEPVLSGLATVTQGRYLAPHTGLFEREDVIHLLEQQSHQADSRVTPEEIALVKQALQFGDYKVRDSLSPRGQVRSVAANDAVSPVLLDELHASGQTSFPVTKSPKSDTIVGSLQLSDIGLETTGLVGDYMTTGVTYIHEADSLADALRVFYQTKQQLFVVVNNFDEYLGVISLEAILQRLVGQPLPQEVAVSVDEETEGAADSQIDQLTDDTPSSVSPANEPETVADAEPVEAEIVQPPAGDETAEPEVSEAPPVIETPVPEQIEQPAADSAESDFAEVSFEATDEPTERFKAPPLPTTHDQTLATETVDDSEEADENLPESDETVVE